MNGKSLSALFALPLVALLAGSCDKASPVAPEGTTLTISATPSQIAISGEASTIRVTVIRPNGTPAFPGTQVQLQTTLGVIDPVIDTGPDGVAVGSLRGDGRIGMATVSARTGNSEAVTADVEIGKFATSLTLQASPAQVPDGGGRVDLLAVVRDDQGRALGGALVNFQTEVGTLDSRGALKSTNSSGEARDVLRVTEADVASFNAPSFTVRAVVGGSGGTQQATATIRILAAKPIADFTPRGAGENKVFFENITQGQKPINYEWDFQNDGTVDSTLESPTYDYGSAGNVTVRLTASNDFGSSTKFKTLSVPVPP
jgi:hypothetical protein